MTPPVPRLALTVAEAATASAIGQKELYRRINAGDLRVVRLGRRIIVPVVELEKWLDREAV